MYNRFRIKLRYFRKMGKWLDFDNPVTFNEKLQWLKAYDHKPLYTSFADKLAVKDIIADKIGDEYIIPTLAVYERSEDIDWNTLPERFVLKCTHDSGTVIVCKDRNQFNKKAALKKLNKRLKRNYYSHTREWPYKDIKPRIIAETYIEDTQGSGELKDYKFFCFNGKVKCFKVDFDRFTDHRANYYDRDGALLPFGEAVCPPDHNRTDSLPANLEQMIFLAEKLAENIPFLRVDFYNSNGSIYFGELTFFPASGVGRFVPDKWDEILGGWIKLPTHTL